MGQPIETPIAYRQVGWMKCVACSDYKRLAGRMWLGVNRAGIDEVVDCPVCNGTGQVAKYQVVDVATGKEIDYESFGRDADGKLIFHEKKEAPNGTRILTQC
jgi:hypothetical protein